MAKLVNYRGVPESDIQRENIEDKMNSRKKDVARYDVISQKESIGFYIWV